VIGLCPVTEIEAKDIDARSQQATNHVLTLARGPHRRHNFSAAKRVGVLNPFGCHGFFLFLSKAAVVMSTFTVEYGRIATASAMSQYRPLVSAMAIQAQCGSG
jgi:hypothetical protein